VDSKASKIFFIFSLFVVWTASAAELAHQSTAQISVTEINPAEEKYFATRDKLCQKFAEGSSDYDALAVLEEPIRSIIVPTKVDGFRIEGSISLYPRYEESPCDHVDGLDFRNPSQGELFVTTKGLLENYLARNPKLPKDLNKLFKADKFYSSVISSDAALTNYADIPVEKTNGQDFAYAFLGGFAQNIGPLIPDHLIVLVSTKKRIYIMSALANTKVPSIPECKAAWDGFAEKSDNALKKYRASNLKDKKSFDEHTRLEARGFSAYYECYRRTSKDQEFFTPLAKQVQSIVDRLQ